MLEAERPTLVTDDCAAEEDLKLFRAAGIDVITVNVAERSEPQSVKAAAR
jgi:hypothetical protein